MNVRIMSELWPWQAVTNSINIRVGRLQVLVDLYALAVILNASTLALKILNIRDPSRRNHYDIHLMNNF